MELSEQSEDKIALERGFITIYSPPSERNVRESVPRVNALEIFLPNRTSFKPKGNHSHQFWTVS